MHASGREVILSRSVIEHYIGNDPWHAVWKHRLRWARGSRRSRPMGYLGEVFTRPTLPAVALWILAPNFAPLAALALAMRLMLVWVASVRVLGDSNIRRRWWLLPAEDIAAFATWVLGFFGNKLVWRGHTLTIDRDGTIHGNS
jgi:ceramide glucosyltransferase